MGQFGRVVLDLGGWLHQAIEPWRKNNPVEALNIASAEQNKQRARSTNRSTAT